MNVDKKKHLDSILKEIQSFVVAFSGGVDSTLLLHTAHNLGSVNYMGVTIRTPYIPAIEIDEAVEYAKKYNIKHQVIDLSFPESIRNNPVDRCYLCKKILFSELLSFASAKGYKYIVEGTNADDTKDYRPGLRALGELGVRSPLLEAGLTKNEIRELLKENGLAVWDKPAMACLLTRIPYETAINETILEMVEKAEQILHEKGYTGSRVRIHGDIARIECRPDDFGRLIRSSEREYITGNLKKAGFRFVTLDLEGYRTGSLNPEKNKS